MSGATTSIYLLLEEEEVITITMKRGISSVIVATSLVTITMNVERKIHQRYMNKPTI
jgi:hypothetical protein